VQVTDAALQVARGLTSLEELNLSDNIDVRDLGLAHLTALRNLRALNLSYSGAARPFATFCRRFLRALDLSYSGAARPFATFRQRFLRARSLVSARGPLAATEL
jgi:hypothetical protein